MKATALCLILAAGLPNAMACTAVDVTAKDGSVVAGRTMEWFYDMQWTLVSFPQGTKYSLTAPPSLKLPDVAQTAKYGFIGVAPGVISGNAILEGQNTAGLGMSGNFLPGFTEYQTVSRRDKHFVSILDFGTWALSSFASVEELKKALPGIKVWYDDSLPSGPTPPYLHMVFTDRTGQGIVVEFVGGEMKIHDNAAHVLTNAPTYDWHLTNLRNYLSVGTATRESVEIGKKNIAELGSGGNTMALRADYSPPSRFVRIAFLRQFSPQPQSSADALQLVAHLLNNVDIPMGVAGVTSPKETVWDTTQWVALKDLTNNRFYIADYDHRLGYAQFDLNRLAKQSAPSRIPVTAIPYPSPADVTSSLSGTH